MSGQGPQLGSKAPMPGVSLSSLTPSPTSLLLPLTALVSVSLHMLLLNPRAPGPSPARCAWTWPWAPLLPVGLHRAHGVWPTVDSGQRGQLLP